MIGRKLVNPDNNRRQCIRRNRLKNVFGIINVSNKGVGVGVAVQCLLLYKSSSLSNCLQNKHIHLPVLIFSYLLTKMAMRQLNVIRRTGKMGLPLRLLVVKYKKSLYSAHLNG